MNLLISEAWGQGAGGAQGGGTGFLIMMVVLFAIMYFMLIRPQQKRVKDHRNMVQSLAKGDEVVTNGGTLGRITHVGEQFLTLEIAEGISIKVQKTAISAVMPKGTIKGSA
ncbi:MAG: preprotein translocase subunit YajC [Acidiferrobacterales bacterium]|nr:preprotein translocase subunit YajC [Acidiferrobacterales bacterium]